LLLLLLKKLLLIGIIGNKANTIPKVNKTIIFDFSFNFI